MKLVDPLRLLCICLLAALAACQAPATPAAMFTPLPPTAAPAAAPAKTGEVLGTIPIGFYPNAVQEGAGSLWYWDSAAGAAARLDPVTNRVVASIPIGDPTVPEYGTPTDLAIEGQAIWFTDNIGHGLGRIDPATNTIAERIPLGTVTTAGQAEVVTPFGLAIDGDSLWVGDFTHSRVLRVDTHSRQIVAMIKVDHPSGLAIGAGAIWVAQHRKGSVVRIDPATNTVVATIALPVHVEGSVCGLCVGMIVASADGIWVPLAAGKAVVRIDPQTNTIAAFIPLKSPANSLSLGNGSVWVAEGLPDPADCKNTSETRPIECGKPADAEHPFADAVCALSAGFVARINPATNTIVDRIEVKCPLSAIVSQGDLWVGSGGPAIYPDMVGAPTVVFRLAVHP